ncbi:MAG: uroporphyrinogen decarboxylase family protein [Oscillospiraceae bacterium]
MIDYAKITPSRQPVGTFPHMAQQPPQPLYPGDRPITARENLLRIFRGETPSWMPVWLYDSQYCWPDVYQEHALWEGTGYDWWGQHWTYVPSALGQMPTPGCRVISDITKWQDEVTFPALDDVDWESDAEIQTARYDPDRAHLFHVVEGIFERLHEMMPMDETLVAMYTEPEQVHAFFRAMVDYKIKLMDTVFKYYAPIDYIIWGDDWAHQKAGFFSNDMFREFIMPYTKTCLDWVHGTGRFVELHSCGLTQQYINEIIEMGLDAWTPQPINDLDMLTAKYAEKLALTVMLPELGAATSTGEAREIIRKFVDKYAPRGKIVAGPLMNKDPEIMKAAHEELYNYSSAFYAKR